MTTSAIIKEIDKLPLPDKLLVIERTLIAIRTNKERSDLEYAAKMLADDYTTDKELTVFAK